MRPIIIEDDDIRSPFWHTGEGQGCSFDGGSRGGGGEYTREKFPIRYTPGRGNGYQRTSEDAIPGLWLRDSTYQI